MGFYNRNEVGFIRNSFLTADGQNVDLQHGRQTLSSDICMRGDIGLGCIAERNAETNRTANQKNPKIPCAKLNILVPVSDLFVL